MLQFKSSWTTTLRRCEVLRVSAPHRESVFGFDSREICRVTVDSDTWGRAEEWEAEGPRQQDAPRPPRRERDLFVQVFAGGSRKRVLSVTRDRGRFEFRGVSWTLGGMERGPLTLRGRGLVVRSYDGEVWAHVRRPGEEGSWLEAASGERLGALDFSGGVSLGLCRELPPVHIREPCAARLLMLGVVVALAVDLDPIAGDWRKA